MNIVVTGGGTGGHVYPALAIIEGFKKRDQNVKITYIGTSNRMEADLIPSLGIDYVGIEMQGLNRKNIFKNIKLIYLLIKNYFLLRKIYKSSNVDLVIGTGGYVTVPVVYTASKMKIPTLIFDADVNFGVATSKLLKHVDIVCSGYEKASLHSDKCIYTGNPRAQIVSENVLRDNVQNEVLFIFGSLGSETMNSFFKQYFNNNDIDYKAIYVTGENHYDTFIDGLDNKNVEVIKYSNNILDLFGRVKYVVGRSGAAFVSEVVALTIPAIYIPSPYVANNEQVDNIEFLLDSNSSLMVEEFSLDEESFKSAEAEINDNYDNYCENLSKLKKNDGLDMILDHAMMIVRKQDE